MKRLSRLLATLVLFTPSAWCQTTQGLIAGRVVDSVSGQAVAAARITWSKVGTPLGGGAVADANGYFNLPLLSPGAYHLRIEALGYQAQELYETELPVAGRLDFNFRLRPLSDIWEAGEYRSVYFSSTKSVLTFYGPDVDSIHTEPVSAAESQRAALETSVSQVIDNAELRDLPLNGRDVYALLVTQPGVTADTTTGRGLGISVNGQRPTASNFLLDGLENDNYLITGPLVTLAPEAVQEYRLSTSNFSAEFGRTSGVLANVISLSGSNQWHGFGYYYLKNDLLNANGFQENLMGFHSPLHYSEPGFFVGGPLQRNTLFVSAALDYERYRSNADPQGYLLPTPLFAKMAAPGTAARTLLEMYPIQSLANATACLVNEQISAPSSSNTNQILALPRADYLRRGRADRFFARVALSRVDRPDFMWTPYSQFTMPLYQDDTALGIGWIRELSPATTNEARLGYSSDYLAFNRQHPEIPEFSVSDGSQSIALPGTPFFFSYLNRNHNIELNDSLTHEHGRHVLKVGGGAILRHLGGYLTVGRDGFFFFGTPWKFLADQPSEFAVAQIRSQPQSSAIPQFNRSYSYNQFFGFAQDSFKVTSRLVLNYGVRYDYFGSPYNVGAIKDALISLGSGSSFPQRLAGATLLPPRTQFDSRGDRGLADFDQRHNFVVYGIQELPAAFASRAIAPLLRNWKVAALAAVRSGFPYTVLGPSSSNPFLGVGDLINNTASIVNPSAAYTSQPVSGGRQLLNASAFAAAGPGLGGNLGRNAFEGPGLYSIDASLSRSFPLPRLGEAGRLVVRADAFNLLNHANLNNPSSELLSPDFGVATYGRQGTQSGFPAVTPFNETARQIQLMVRVDF